MARRYCNIAPLAVALLALFPASALAAKKTQTISVEKKPPSTAVIGSTYTWAATASSGLPVSVNTEESPSVCSVSGSIVTFKAEGTCHIDFNQKGNGEYEAAPEVKEFTKVLKRSQTITFTSTAPSNATVGGPSYEVKATGGASGNPVTFTIDAASSGCAISGATVSFTGAGTCKVDANQAGNAEYAAAAQAQQSFAVAKKSQTVTFTSSPPANPTVGGQTYAVSATASSGLAVSFSSATTSVCTVSGSTVSFVAEGGCTIVANQAGNVEYEAAPESTQSFKVTKRSQTITFTSTAPSNATVGGPSYEVKASGGGSGNAVTFTIDAASSGCTTSGATVSFTGAGTCKVDANQAGNTEYTAAPQVQQSFAVAKKSQTVAFTSSAPANAVVGGPSYSATASASSSLAVSFSSATTNVCTVSGSTVSFIGAGSCTIDANQAGNGEYEAAPQVQQTFAVAKKSQTVAFTSTPPGSATVGGPGYEVTASGGGSGNPVTFTIDAASSGCTISGATVSFTGAGTCKIDANQAGNGEYGPAPQVQQAFPVGKKSQTLTITSKAPTGAIVGGPTYNVTAEASSGLAVSFSTATPSTCTVSGTTVSFVGGGTCTIEGKQEGNAEYSPAKAETQSFPVERKSQTLAFEPPPPPVAVVGEAYVAKVSASSGLAPSLFGTTPAVCKVAGMEVTFVGEGECTIEAKQEGNSAYSPAKPESRTIAVRKAKQTITITSTAPSNATVGGPSYEVKASGGASGNPVTFTIDAASSGCTISGATVSFTGVGTCTIDANQAGNSEYAAAKQVQQSFAVSKASQAITYTSTPPGNAKVGGPTYEVKATGGGSGNPVTFTIDASSKGACSIAGAVVSFTAVGTCTVDANQAGSESYEAALQVQQSFAVAKGSQAISYSSTPPGNAKVGGPTYEVKATGGGSGNPVTFTIDASSKGACSIAGAVVSFTAVGTCTVDANQAGSESYEAALQVQQSFAVAKGSQAITFTSNEPKAAVGGSYEAKATGGGSGNPVTFTIDPSSKGACSIAGAIVSFVATGTCTIDANQLGNANYEAAPPMQQALNVVKGAQVITFTTSPPKPALPGETYAVGVTGGGSNEPIKLSSPTPTVCRITGPVTPPTTVKFVGTGECEIDATQAGNEGYEPAPLATQSFTVGTSEALVVEPPHEGHSTPPPIKKIEAPPLPNSSFKVIAASLSLTTYAITFEESVVDPGTFTWVLTFENGKYGVFAAKVKRCKTGSVRLKGKCRPGKVLFARGSETVTTTGPVTFMVRPTANGIKAMKNAFKLHKGLPVTALVTFQSTRGGPSASRVQSLIVKGRR